jgi:hypothetical protein
MPLRDPHLQRRVRHVRVDLRRRDAAVAEEALDVADVDALLQEVGGHRVAEHGGVTRSRTAERSPWRRIRRRII